MTVTACDRHDQPAPFSFRYLDVIGNGTFGIVCRARDLSTGEVVAIKTVYQDEGHQNRELAIIKSLDHPNIVALRRYFYTRNEYREEFLSLVLEWMPTSVDRVLREHEKSREPLPLGLIKRGFQQFTLALQYLHGVGVCHRDIKPHNLLIDQSTGIVKLCDFGCSKRLARGEPNIQYICARYYRAPEIVLGWEHYSTAIDMWSAGCVLAELLSGRPIFPGTNSIDQLAKIIKILGSPTLGEMSSMGQAPKRLGIKTPFTPEQRWESLRTLIPEAIPREAIDLLAALLQYSPEARLKPAEILLHPFLADLKPLSEAAEDLYHPGSMPKSASTAATTGSTKAKPKVTPDQSS